MDLGLKPHTKGLLLIFISTIMFGSYGVWSQLMGNSFGVFYQAWTRALIVSFILIPILLVKKEIIPIKKNDLGWLCIFLCFTSATQAPIFYAFTHMDIGSATLLFFVSVLLTMYSIGFIFLGEKFSFIKGISFFLALIGLSFIFSLSLERFTLLAASMAVLNGIASGGEVAFSKKLSGDYSPLYLTLLSWLIIIPTNGFLSILLKEKQLLPSFDVVWLWQGGYIIASIFAFWFVIAGLKYVEASIGGILGLLEIVFSIGFGMLFFGEPLSIRSAIGALLILIAASLPHVYGLIKKA